MRASLLPIITALGASAAILPLNPSPHIKTSDRTVYDVIRDLDSSAKFKDYLDRTPDLRNKLQDLSHKYTVFVPTDEAFDKLPDNLKKHLLASPDIGTEDFLRYHIVHGDFSGPSMIPLHTIPSLLNEEDLGNHPQRLRIDAGVANTDINFYARILSSKTDGRNGAVHQLDSVLTEPLRQGKLLEHLPGDYSTSRLALEKTNLGKWLHRQSAQGSTAFIPSNKAWEAVPDEVRNWLFSEEGKDYLRVIFEYHVVFDRTLYSDALYLGKSEDRHSETVPRKAMRANKRMIVDECLWHATHRPAILRDVPECQEGSIPDHDSDGSPDASTVGSKCQVTFPTVLEKGQLKVEVSRLMGHVTIRLNDRIDVSNADGIARDGVLHAVDDVLLPCREATVDGHGHEFTEDKLLKEMELEELKKYLKSFVERDERLVGGHNHWMDGKTPDFEEIMEEEEEEESGRVSSALEKVKQTINHLLDDLEL